LKIESWLADTAVVAATGFAIWLSVVMHYEGLSLLSRGIRRTDGRQRAKVLYAIYSVLALHIIEVWLFGIVLWLIVLWPACGYFAVGAARDTLSLLDTVYFSALTYTTVGFGDVVPVGPVRFIAGTEAIIGFVLIAWSASFIYMEMERLWRDR
jgi:hypothetical protein